MKKKRVTIALSYLARIPLSLELLTNIFVLTLYLFPFSLFSFLVWFSFIGYFIGHAHIPPTRSFVRTASYPALWNVSS